MTFDKEFKLIIIPKFISFFVTIGLAFYLRSFWALVIGNVVWKFIEVIASYSMHPFRPKLNISKANELFSFSKWLMINNLFMFINSRAPDLILGKLISPHGAAIYNISYEIGTMSTSEVIANINRSIYPGYSKVKDNISKLQDIYLTSIKAISILALPLGTGVALLSPIVVPVFLGDQWNEAIEPLFYIALAAALNALKSNTAYVLYAREMPRITTFDLAFKSFLFLSLLLILIDLNGVVGAAQAFFYSSLTSLIISFFIIKKAIMLPISVQLGVYIKPVIANLTMTLNILLAFQYLPLSGIIGIVFYTILGAVSYTSVLYIAWVLSGKPSGLEEMILNFIKNKLSFIKQIL